jgi:hypothetical protein
MAKIALNRYKTFTNMDSQVARVRAKSGLDLAQKALALFPTAIAFAPNEKIREETKKVEKEIVAILKKVGTFYKKELFFGKALLGFARGLKLKYKIFGHRLEQPKLTRREYPNENCIPIPILT